MHFEEIARGVFHVRRRPEEEPFAQVTAPKAMPVGRNWGVTYRGYGEPFGDVFNVCPPTRADVEYELRHAIRACSDYQLGLSPTWKTLESEQTPSK